MGREGVVFVLCLLLVTLACAEKTSRWAVQVDPSMKAHHDRLVSFFSTLGFPSVSEPLELNDKLFYVLQHTSSIDEGISARLQKAIDKQPALGIVYFEQLSKLERSTRSIKPIDRGDFRASSVHSLSSRHVNDFLPADPLFEFQWHLQNTGQTGGTAGMDVNIVPVWNMGYTGQNVTICIVDDGLQIAHPDISPNYYAKGSWNYNDNLNDPTSDEPHGTSAGGVATAATNSKCGVGAAFAAKVSGVQILTVEALTANIEANALVYDMQNNLIFSNSWGPSDDGKTLERLSVLVSNALEHGVTKGRNGLGSIYVWAGGNGNQAKDNSNYDGYANSRLTIAVSACDHNGVQSYYSEPGANILVTAPSSSSEVGITTSDLLGGPGYSNGDCTNDFGGTSSACPLVAGVIGLVIEARPDLTWRDVQHVLVHSSTKNDPSESGWKKNGAGLWVNHKYGFGLVNAEAAVNLALKWTLVNESYLIDSGRKGVEKTIPDDGSVLEDSIEVEVNGTLEHVEVIFTASHRHPSDLEIVLVSPSGTESILSELHGFETKAQLFGALSTTVTGAMAEFSGPVPSDGLKGSIIVTTPTNGCSDMSFTSNIRGRMALIARGDCTFAEKAILAQAAGASAMILYDNVPGEKPWSVIGDANVTIPVMMISNSDGLAIDSAIKKSPTKMIDNVVMKNVTQKADDETTYTDYKFSSVHCWDEPAAGIWTLRVRDLYSDSTASSSGVWKNWKLNTFVITNEPVEDKDDMWLYVLLGLSIVFGGLLVVGAIGYALFVGFSRFRRTQTGFEVVDDLAGPDDFTIDSE